MASPARPDRAAVERNRRAQMRALYSQLYGLLPPTARVRTYTCTLSVPLNVVCDATEVLGQQEGGSPRTLPDRLDEVVSYIKEMEMRVKRLKEMKGELVPASGGGGSRRPQIEVQDFDGGAWVVLMNCGAGNTPVFYELVRLLEEEGAEIVNASFYVDGDRAFYTVHSKLIEGHRIASHPGTMVDRLKNAIHSFANVQE